VSLLLLYFWFAGSWPDSHSGGATGFGIGGGALKAGTHFFSHYLAELTKVLTSSQNAVFKLILN
jgi:hypothetical protein